MKTNTKYSRFFSYKIMCYVNLLSEHKKSELPSI